MKRATVLVLAALLALLLGLSGCGSEKTVRFGTGGIGGTYYAYGTALAQMISEENDKLSSRSRPPRAPPQICVF